MNEGMPRVDAIIAHPRFCTALACIEEAERNRVFCRHGLGHLLDVARIAWIVNLEEGCGLGREMVYAAALLHDIGRAEEYSCGVSHDIAGVAMAKQILGTLPADKRFSSDEEAAICTAVAAHRGKDQQEDAETLARLIARADGLSRPCFSCAAQDACYWSDERKNLALRI